MIWKFKEKDFLKKKNYSAQKEVLDMLLNIY